MSETTSSAGSLPGEGGGLVPQSPTAEGGEGLSGNPEVNAEPGTGADEAQADAPADAEPEPPHAPPADSVDGETDDASDPVQTDESEGDLPEWDVTTHGPLGEERKGQYREING